MRPLLQGFLLSGEVGSQSGFLAVSVRGSPALSCDDRGLCLHLGRICAYEKID